MKGPAGLRWAPRAELAAGLGLADRQGANPAGAGPGAGLGTSGLHFLSDARRPRPVHTVFIDRARAKEMDRAGMGSDFSSPSTGWPGPRRCAPISGLCCRSPPSQPPAPQVPGFISVF